MKESTMIRRLVLFYNILEFVFFFLFFYFLFFYFFVLLFIQCTPSIQIDNSVPGVDHTLLTLEIADVSHVWLLRSSQPIVISNSSRRMKYSAVLCDFHIVGTIFLDAERVPKQRWHISIRDARISITF